MKEEQAISAAKEMADKFDRCYDIVKHLPSGEYFVYRTGEKDNDPDFAMIAIAGPGR